MSAPALVFRIELERAPEIHLDVLNDAELLRLCDWIDAHPTFFRVVAQLYRLVEEER